VAFIPVTGLIHHPDHKPVPGISATHGLLLIGFLPCLFMRS
jgi:hypothetical protein